MKRPSLLIGLIVSCLPVVLAQAPPQAIVASACLLCVETGPGEPVPAARRFEELLSSNAERSLAELTIGELALAADLASLAGRQVQHVRRSERLSRIVPGAGQYINGKAGRAFGFFAADLTIQVAAGLLGYVFLPAAVQFRNLNYLQTPFSDIGDRWSALTPAELLPSFAIVASGGILSAIVRALASSDARAVAMEALETGTASVLSSSVAKRGG